MLLFGDIHILVSDFASALRFYCEGLGLQVVEQQASDSAPFALLEFPQGGPGLRLLGGVDGWAAGERTDPAARPGVRFDLMTSTFDETLATILDFAGQQLDEIETYSGLRVVSVADPDGNSFELVEIPDDGQDESPT